MIVSSGILIVQNSVTYKVKDESSEPLIEATAAIEGTLKGTVIDTKGIAQFEPLVLPPTNNPTFTGIWAPTDGFVFNGGVKFSLF